MKVVLFCGGLGMRLREYSETIPKPMVNIGQQPILWYLMKYYAHYGFTDFVLCLGYRGDAIKSFFLNYNECLTNDFVMSAGSGDIHLYNSDIQNWTITFVDTGQHTNIGQRLNAVRKHLDGEEYFLANYSDGLSDLPLDQYIEFFKKQNKIASFVGVHPHQSFHIIQADGDNLVTEIRRVDDSVRINGGFFIFKNELFDHMEEGEELLNGVFQRLASKKQLVTYLHDGFWKCMDTFKDKQQLDEMFTRGDTPWVVW